MSFVHLHTHSEYSMLDGAARVTDLVKRAGELGMPALALTDHGFMYGAIEFYKRAVEAGIKPLLGCEVYFTPDDRTKREGKPELYHLLLLAKTDAGYRNLMALVSDAATAGYYYRPQVDMALLEQYADGLIGTSACMSGIVSKSIELGQPEKAKGWAERYVDLFGPGDFYLEIQNQGVVSERGVSQTQLNAEIKRIAEEVGAPLVATNDVHYLAQTDAETQDLLLCIGTGSTVDQTDRMRFSCDQFYMKSPDEMCDIMREYPDAVASTLEIAEKCQVELEFDRIILPAYHSPDGLTEDQYLRELCLRGLRRRYGDPPPADALERLDIELGVIEEKGFAAYFLIVADFVNWAKEHDIGVGPGRGSAAGSIIAYTLGVTNLDPIAHGLLFERFLNPERTEMPDIDIDFDDERRGEVIDYVREIYGEDRVAQIITFNTMKARAAVRDAGRVLGYPYGVPDRIAKLIPERLVVSDKDKKKGTSEIEIALRTSPDLRAEHDANPDSKRILDSAKEIEGIVRGEGVHAAGVVICGEPLHHFTPVKRDTKGGATITQYEGKLIGELGLLKMDFLGLRTLTVLAKAREAIRAQYGTDIDLDAIPLDDPDTFKLLQRADTDGVFQVESAGMKKTLKQLKPTKFADLVAVIALFRPGPMDAIPDFIDRKHGRKPVTYYDERIRHILEETYGAIVYQEQAMRICMEMGGFSAAKADKLRKGMGKKIQDIVDALKPEFIEGAVGRGYERRVAEQVWRDIEKFGEYAFNKSHAAAYALLANQTAYLKAHYPLEFMAAVLTSHTGKTETIVKYVAASNRAGMSVLPPDVNSSRADFTATEEGIRFGLAGIRGVGEGVVEHIIGVRDAGGPFASLYDFCERVDMRQLNKKTLEALIKAGAFDSTGYTRKQLMAQMDSCVDSAVKRQKDQEAGQTTMFDLLEAEDTGFAEEVPSPDGVEWDRKIKLAFEKEMLGIYVSDHPLRGLEAVLREHTDYSVGETEELANGTEGWFGGIVASLDRKSTRKGDTMAVAMLEDLDGAIEAVLFPQSWSRFQDIVAEDTVVRVKAKFEVDERGRKLVVNEAESLTGSAFEAPPGRIVVKAEKEALHNGRADRLRGLLERYPGDDVLELRVRDEGRTIVCKMPQKVDRGSSALFAELMDMFGGGSVREG